MIDDDAQDMARARAAHAYGDKQNSIVAWTLSDEWTETPPMAGSKIAQTTSGFRSTVVKSSWTGYGVKRTALMVDSVSGEIDCSSCSCHRPGGRSW